MSFNRKATSLQLSASVLQFESVFFLLLSIHFQSNSGKIGNI